METRGFVLQKVEESYAALCQRLAGAALTGQHSGTWGLQVPLGTFLPEHVPGVPPLLTPGPLSSRRGLCPPPALPVPGGAAAAVPAPCPPLPQRDASPGAPCAPASP